QLFLGINGGVEGEAVTDCLQAAAVRIRNRKMRTAVMAAVLLRTEIILVLLCDGCFILAEERRTMLIAVALERAVAEVLYCVEGAGQEEAQAEARQIGEVLRTIHMDV